MTIEYREYTIQYMEEQDWVRIGAIYETIDSVLYHAKDILAQGRVVRILTRNRNHSKVWHTMKITNGAIVLNNPVYGCPQ